MELELREEKEGIAGTLRYATALFDEATIERQAGYLMRMLEAMVADSRQEVAGIDLLEEEERKLLLETWNATEAEYPEELCIMSCLRSRCAGHRRQQPWCMKSSR